MTSIILPAATKYLLPLLLLLSIYLLLYGHNSPGGGFVGGLVAAAAFVLYAIANGAEEARRLLRVDSKLLIGIGLLLVFLSGILPLFLRECFLTGIWLKAEPLHLELGTPLLFDTGIYLVVIGVVLTIIFTLAED